MKASYLGPIIALLLVIAPSLVGLDASQAPEAGEEAEAFPSYLTSNDYNETSTSTIYPSPVLSAKESASSPINPNVIKVTQNIYGVLPPWTYDSYDIRGTIAICVDLDYDPDEWYIWVGIWDEETNTWYRRTGINGTILWCPDTDGYEELRIANPQAPYTHVYIAYVGTLTKYYW